VIFSEGSYSNEPPPLKVLGGASPEVRLQCSEYKLGVQRYLAQKTPPPFRPVQGYLTYKKTQPHRTLP